jgi:hypothetical protein
MSSMPRRAFDKIAAGLREAIAIAEGIKPAGQVDAAHAPKASLIRSLKRNPQGQSS